jgi:HPt (histidine-containing phosphotransfer) domain-containing protein
MASDLPTLDLELAEQLYPAISPDEARVVREFFAEFVRDVPARFARLRAANPPPTNDAAVRELHQLRGVVANFAMTAAASHVKTLELEWRMLAPAQRQQHLTAAEREIQQALALIREKYPHVN